MKQGEGIRRRKGKIFCSEGKYFVRKEYDVVITGQYSVKLLSKISPWSYYVLELYLVFKT